MNKLFLSGRLTADPEVKTYGEGKNKKGFVKFSVAVDRGYAKKGEERKTDFFNCTAFGTTAQFISNYFVKGQKILLEGQLNIDKVQTEKEMKQYINVIVSNVEFADSKQKENETDELPF